MCLFYPPHLCICFIIHGCDNMIIDHVCPDTWNGESFRASGEEGKIED